jgi:hypothetical protein
MHLRQQMRTNVANRECANLRAWLLRSLLWFFQICAWRALLHARDDVWVTFEPW